MLIFNLFINYFYIHSSTWIQSNTQFCNDYFYGAHTFTQWQNEGVVWQFSEGCGETMSGKKKYLHSLLEQTNTYNRNSHNQEEQRLWVRSLPLSLHSVTATQIQWYNCAIVDFFICIVNLHNQFIHTSNQSELTYCIMWLRAVRISRNTITGANRDVEEIKTL